MSGREADGGASTTACQVVSAIVRGPSLSRSLAEGQRKPRRTRRRYAYPPRPIPGPRRSRARCRSAGPGARRWRSLGRPRAAAGRRHGGPAGVDDHWLTPPAVEWVLVEVADGHAEDRDPSLQRPDAKLDDPPARGRDPRPDVKTLAGQVRLAARERLDRGVRGQRRPGRPMGEFLEVQGRRRGRGDLEAFADRGRRP
jgi:hypothetical protein